MSSNRDSISTIDLASFLYRAQKLNGLNFNIAQSLQRSAQNGVDLMVFDIGDLTRVEIMIKPLTPSSRGDDEFNFQMIYNQKELFSKAGKTKGKNVIKLYLGYSRILDLFLAPSQNWFETASNQGSIFADRKNLVRFDDILDDSILFEKYSKIQGTEDPLYKAFFRPEFLFCFVELLINRDVDAKTNRPVASFDKTDIENFILVKCASEKSSVHEALKDTQVASSPRFKPTSERVILTGPPGTGKTFAAKERAFAGIRPITDQLHTTIVQFHPSYSYPQFVEGVFPTTYFDGKVIYQVVDGVLMVKYRQATGSFVEVIAQVSRSSSDIYFNLPIGTFARYQISDDQEVELALAGSDPKVAGVGQDCLVINLGLIREEQKDSLKDGAQVRVKFRSKSWGQANVVLIVDEINRGNVPEIFGELLYSLSEDEDSPNLPVQLQYSQTPFSWPSNLSVIGTMNASDRSTGELDQALKRRFKFVQLYPQHERLAPMVGAFKVKAIKTLFDSDPFGLKGADVAASCDFVIRMANEVLKSAPVPRELPALSVTLGQLNHLICADEFGVFDAKEKQIGHSFYIKVARQIADILYREFGKNNGDRLKDKAVCHDVSRRILNVWNEVHLKEVLPQIKSILSNNPELSEYFIEKWQPNLIKDLSEYERLISSNVAS